MSRHSTNFFAGFGIATGKPSFNLTRSGRLKLTVRVAFPRAPRRPSKTDRTDSDYYTVVALGKQFQAFKGHLERGTPIVVFGYMQSRDITIDGEPRTVSEVMADEIFLVTLPEDLGKDNEN